MASVCVLCRPCVTLSANLCELAGLFQGLSAEGFEDVRTLCYAALLDGGCAYAVLTGLYRGPGGFALGFGGLS